MPGYEVESNNSLASANSLLLGTTINGQLSSFSDIDCYTVVAGAGGALNITFADPSGNYSTYTITAYNNSGSVLGSWFTSTDAVCRISANAADTYYVSVAGATNTGQYSLAIESDIAGSTGTDATLSSSENKLSSIDFGGDTDYFKVQLIAGTAYQFDLKGSATSSGTLADPYLILRNSSNTAVCADDDGASVYPTDGYGYSSNSQLVFIAPETATYFLDVSGYSSSTGSYQLSETTLAPDYFIQPLLLQPNDRWNEGHPLGTPVSVTYSFPTTIPAEYDGYDLWNFIPFSESQKNAAREALQLVSTYANISFREVSSQDGQIRFATTYQSDSVGVTVPFSDEGHSDVALANNYSLNTYPTVGSAGWEVLLHEIGHALGLKHPGNYNAGNNGADPPYLPSSQDSSEFTVETYNDSVIVKSPMIFDIAALQYLYGANASTNTGDSSYLFDGGAVYAIWDSSGDDTLDASGWTTSLLLNLTPGSVSYSGHVGLDATATPVVAIAFNAWIENARGGSGSDSLFGNVHDNVMFGGGGDDTLSSGGGNDTLIGEAGDDHLFGEGGDDLFIYTNGADQIVGGTGRDTVLFGTSRASAATISSGSVSFGDGNAATLDSVEVKGFLEVNHGGTFVAGQAYYHDVNGDGRVDLTMQNENLQFWLSIGSGNGLTSPSLAIQHGGPPSFIRNQTQFADINGDHYADAVFQGLDNRFWASFGAAGGYGNPQLVAQHGGSFNPEQVQYADVTGDGAEDLIFQGTDNRFWLSRSNGSGFDNPILCATHGGPFSPASVRYGDVSGDGKADLIFQGVDNRFWISLSNGSTFGNPYWANTHGGAFNPAKVQYADISGDGRVDLVYQGDDNRFWLSLSDGAKFNTPVLAAAVTHDDFNTDQARYSDMNGDGRADLVYQGDGNEFWFYESNGSGFATGRKVVDAGGVFHEGSAGYGDVDGDGSFDIIFQNPTNDFYVFLNSDWYPL